MKLQNFNMELHVNQSKIFMGSNKRFKVIAKGRRFGLTKGMANYNILRAAQNQVTMLWVDTIYSNIERYYERYFLPVLKPIDKMYHHYSKRTQQLYIRNSVIDFRSADRPENLEGYGYNMITINEAGIVLKNRRLWTESILPMTIDYKAEVIIGGTPKGKYIKKNEKHLFYELWQKGNYPGDWESFNFSSYDNPYVNQDEVKEVEKEIPAFLREQEIYGRFVEQNEAGLIKNDWWRYYTELNKNEIIKKFQSWDTAFKTNEENDFSVCTTWAMTKSHFFLLDVFRERLEFPELKRKVVELADIYEINEILIEDKASGQSLIQELERETRLPIKKIKVDKDKFSRFIAITPMIESGRIYLPESAPWLETFLNEFEEFPNGEFDDQVDSVTQAINENKSAGVVDYAVRTVSVKSILGNRK
ncbi:MAG: phage terminase large subunit [Ignavibacteriaceae bacterium]